MVYWRQMGDDLDLGEAADYILGERPRLDPDDVWAVLSELGDPPARAGEDLALDLLRMVRPDLGGRTARTIIHEWRAYARLAREHDWDDD